MSADRIITGFIYEIRFFYQDDWLAIKNRHTISADAHLEGTSPHWEGYYIICNISGPTPVRLQICCGVKLSLTPHMQNR